MKAAEFLGQPPAIVERDSVKASSAEGVVYLLRGALAILERGNREAADYLRCDGASFGEYDYTDRGVEVQIVADRIGFETGLCDLTGTARVVPLVQHEADDVELPAWASPSPEDFGDATAYLRPVLSLLVAIAINPRATGLLANSMGATRVAAIACLAELHWEGERVPKRQ